MYFILNIFPLLYCAARLYININNFQNEVRWHLKARTKDIVCMFLKWPYMKFLFPMQKACINISLRGRLSLMYFPWFTWPWDGCQRLSSHRLCLLRFTLPSAASAWQQPVQPQLSGRSRHGVLPAAPVLLLVLCPHPQLRRHGERPPFIQDELHPHLQPLLPLWQHWEGRCVWVPRSGS